MKMEIGEKIKNIRKNKGITQKKLSELSNVHVSQLARYESGKSKPTLEIIIKIANALNVDVVEILSSSVDENSDDYISFVLSDEFDKVVQEQFKFEIKENHLEFIYIILDEMGYTMKFDMTSNINDVFIEEKNLTQEQIEKMNYTYAYVTKEELLQIQEESKDFFKFKLHELIKQRDSQSKKADAESMKRVKNK